MKKHITKLALTLALLTISLVGFSQLSPAGHFRIADRTTAFGINIPAGSQIYCVSDSTTWEVKVELISTKTITTGLSSLFLVAKSTNLSVGTVTTTTVDVNSSTGTSATLPAATTSAAGVMTAAQATTVSNQSGTNTGNQTLTIGGTTSPTITLSGSNTATFAGAGITTLGQSGGTITITSTEVDGSVTNEGALTVGAGTGTTSLIHSNTSGSTDVTIAAGTGLSITENTGTGTITLASTVGSAYIAESFEEATTGSSGTAHTLAHTPVTTTTGLTIQLNGLPLTSSQYTQSGTSITVTIPVYKYDRVMVSYVY